MKTLLLALTLMFAAHEAGAACAEKRSRDPSFVELAVPDDAPRPAERRGLPLHHRRDHLRSARRQGRAARRRARARAPATFIWCFADGTELTVATKDRVVIESVRYDGKEIFKRAKKKK